MKGSFTWEKEYKRTWEDETIIKRNEFNKNVKYEYNDKKKGIIRHLHVMIDTSFAVDKNDFLPSFRTTIMKSLEEFIPLFYKENPISGLSFSTVRDVLTRYSNDSNINIKEFLSKKGEGFFSLYNGLHGVLDLIKKDTYCKEILVITSSLVLKDPDSYTEIFEQIKKLGIKIHIISLCGELMIYKKIVNFCGGKLYIPLDIDHFNFVLKGMALPTESVATTINLIKLGFPTVIHEKGICICHGTFHKYGYECPVCKTFICKLPMKCTICSTQLVSTANIIKSFHHLYPIESFDTVSNKECFVCKNTANHMCSKCKNCFCDKCNNFIHHNLNFCIGCK